MKQKLLLFLLLLTSLATYAYDFESNGIYYTITSDDDKTVEVTYLEQWKETPSYTGDLTIPEIVTYSDVEYSVISIGSSAFEVCSTLTNIELPASVTTIGDYAFCGCESLTSIELPASLTSIGEGAFAGCSSLKTVTSLNPEPPTLNSFGFYACPLKTVYVPTEAIESYQTAYGWEDYYIVDISYKNLVTDFEVDGIYYHVTSDTDKSVEVTSGVTAYTGDVVIPETVTYSDTEYTVTSIGEKAFYECSTLTSIELPASVTTIGDYAFCGCESLTSIELPQSVTTIVKGAFAYCISLTNIELPASLTLIGDYAFEGCAALEKVTSLNPEPPTIAEGVFSDCPILAIYVPLDAIERYQAADGWKDYKIVDIAYKDFVTYFRVDGIYYHVTSDTDKSVEVTSGVPAYTGDVVIPETVTYSDTEYTVTSIGEKAFYECSSLSSIELPASVTSIGDYAFDSCTVLSNFVIPMTITSIAGEAFANCTSLAVITSLNPTPPALDGNTFNGCSILSVYVPSDAVEAYQAAENWNNFNIVDVATSGEGIVTNFTVDGINYRVTSLKDNRVSVVAGDYSGDIVIPATVTYDEKEFVVDKIGYEAFSGCSAVTGITIPSTVTQIDSYAFCGTAISSISIPNSVNQIGWYALNECPQLKDFTIEDGETALTIGDSLGNDLWTGETIETLYVGRNIEFDGQYGAFDSNGNLKSVTFGEQVTNIYDWFFYNDTSLTSVTIPGSVTSIGDYAFCGCRSLAVIELPASLTSIGDYAFYECSSLKTVISFNQEPPTLDSTGFDGCPIEVVYVLDEAVDSYKGAEGWNEFNIISLAQTGVEDAIVGGDVFGGDTVESATVYTLQGVRVKGVRTMDDVKSLTPGLYIVNGKKVFVK
jgi:hypothetical protein